jgi:hypothetical protein
LHPNLMVQRFTHSIILLGPITQLVRVSDS